MTKDERFLIELSRRGESDPLALGKSLGYKEHLVNNILRGLMQANLVKRIGACVALTARGEEVARELQG